MTCCHRRRGGFALASHDAEVGWFRLLVTSLARAFTLGHTRSMCEGASSKSLWLFLQTVSLHPTIHNKRPLSAGSHRCHRGQSQKAPDKVNMPFVLHCGLDLHLPPLAPCAVLPGHWRGLRSSARDFSRCLSEAPRTTTAVTSCTSWPPVQSSFYFFLTFQYPGIDD